MWTAAVLMAATVLQAKEEMDGYQRRRVYEATLAAKDWAWDKSRDLFPDSKVFGKAAAERRAFLTSERRRCEQALRVAALHQVCDAYKMKPSEVRAVMADPSKAVEFPHDPEKELHPEKKFDLPRWEMRGTLFDPAKVKLSPSLCKRFGYKNPGDRAKDKEFNRRRPSQDIKDQLLGSPSPSESPPSGSSTKN